MDGTIKHHRETDLRGMCCAQPILRMVSEFRTMQSGDVLLALADKASLLKDIPAFCTQTGHLLLNQESTQDIFRFWIQKA